MTRKSPFVTSVIGFGGAAGFFAVVVGFFAGVAAWAKVDAGAAISAAAVHRLSRVLVAPSGFMFVGLRLVSGGGANA